MVQRESRADSPSRGRALVKHFKAIAAMAENRVIGARNRIPWRLPADLDWFKRMTTGQVVVMGRKAFEAIGTPLPNRATVVLSRSIRHIPGVRVVSGLEDIDPAREPCDVFICGGSEIYAQGLPLCSDLYLTHVKGTFDGDSFFPPFEAHFAPVAMIADQPEFRIVHYRNVALSTGCG